MVVTLVMVMMSPAVSAVQALGGETPASCSEHLTTWAPLDGEPRGVLASLNADGSITLCVFGPGAWEGSHAPTDGDASELLTSACASGSLDHVRDPLFIDRPLISVQPEELDRRDPSSSYALDCKSLTHDCSDSEARACSVSILEALDLESGERALTFLLTKCDSDFVQTNCRAKVNGKWKPCSLWVSGHCV